MIESMVNSTFAVGVVAIIFGSRLGTKYTGAALIIAALATGVAMSIGARP